MQQVTTLHAVEVYGVPIDEHTLKPAKCTDSADAALMLALLCVQVARMYWIDCHTRIAHGLVSTTIFCCY